MRYRRMPIEIESPEERGYDTIACNLTESSVADQRLGDLGLDLEDLVLCYGDHRGDPSLRDLVAADAAGVSPESVLTSPGAAAALFMISTSLLDHGDHAIIAHTNYATNLETPRLLGAEIDLLPLRFEDGFALDLDRLADTIRPSTRLVSLTYPHNPTGVMIDRGTLDEVVTMVEKTGAHLLVDETYRDMTRGEPLPVAATLSERAISVSSMSKSYGLPGIRVGWLMSQDRSLGERLLAAKEQIFICTSGLDEAVASHVLARRDQILPPILATIESRLAAVTAWMTEQTLLEWVEPQGGVVCFPRLLEHVDVDRFYRHLNEVGATWVGEGHWFDVDRRSFRLGFGWPGAAELDQGLAAITAAAELAVR